jgi:hypothetical protein
MFPLSPFEDMTMLNGTLDYNGLLIEWEACDSEDDGFYWHAVQIGQQDQHGYLSLTELADVMRRDHDTIDAAVRKAFHAALNDEQTEAAIAAWESAA